MSVHCFPPVRGKRLRVTRLDGCGNVPDTPANLNVVSKGFVSVALTEVIEEGDDIILKNADGDLEVNDRSRNQLKRYDVAIELTKVDPAILSLLTNAELVEDWNSNVVGIDQPEGGTVDSFALEVWTGVPGTDCIPGEPARYGYLLLPFVIGGPLGGWTIENGASTFTINSYTRGAGGWGKGPYDVEAQDVDNTPGPLITPLGPTVHKRLIEVTIPPPDPDCDFKTTPLPPVEPA